jgi:hypothetical protein
LKRPNKVLLTIANPLCGLSGAARFRLRRLMMPLCFRLDASGDVGG